MKKTGELLREAREQKGFSLHEIGLSLKISSKVLKAIEDGDSSQYPAKTFLRGFIQSYANYLKLDTEKILESFYTEMGSTRPEVTPEPSQNGSVQEPTLDTLVKKNHTKLLITVGVMLALLLVIFIVNQVVEKYSKEAQLTHSEPTAVQPGLESTGTKITGTAQPTAAVVAPIQSPSITETVTASNISTTTTPPSSTANNGSTTAPVAAPQTPAAPTNISSTVNKEKKDKPVNIDTVTVKNDVAQTPTPQAKPAPPTPSNNNLATTTPIEKNIELVVEALDQVEIEYSGAQGKMQKMTLSADQVHTFKSKYGLKLSVTNGGAINLILNGKDLGVPGDLGKPIKLSY
ncbi:MAG: helix-turn-helix domain-containing protein [Pseudobdellovibrionaceae bacterium]